jgi:putative flippase GtrA
MDGQHFIAAPGRRKQIARQISTFAAIGVVSTAAYVLLYAWLRNAMPEIAANATALMITAVGNTAANRRLTFDAHGSEGLARDHAAGLLALAVALAITTSSLAALSFVAPHHGRLSEIGVLVSSNAAATLVRYLLLRMAIERRNISDSQVSAGRTLSTAERTH